MGWLANLFGAKDERPHSVYSLHVGLNRVSPEAYGGWDGPLIACENDAICMSRVITATGGHVCRVLLTEDARRENLLGELAELAQKAQPGDLAVVTNSSHGGQIPDYDGNEADGWDETICMFDGEVIDDELEAAWARFRPGVRIMFVSDSCHSGTMVRLAPTSEAAAPEHRARSVPFHITSRIITDHDSVLRARKSAVRGRAKIRASVLSYGACQDNQVAYDGRENGAFTGALLSAVTAHPRDCYGRIIARVRRALPPHQSPKYGWTGARDETFESSPAFRAVP